MAGFFLALVAALIAGLGARDQQSVAALSARQGRRGPVLLVALAGAAVTTGITVWAAQAIASHSDDAGRQLLCSLALGLAGLEMVLTRPLRIPAEPTDSLGALALVLLAQRLTGAACLLLFAIVIGTGASALAGLGGALGAGGILAAGWMAGGDLAVPRLGTLRRSVGVLLLAVLMLGGLR